MSEDRQGGIENVSLSIDIRLAELAEGFSGGILATNVMVGSSENMFFLDFYRVVAIPSPEGLVSEATLLERVFISPHLMKGLASAIQSNIEKYEETWGIELPDLKQIKSRREGA